MVCRTLGSRHLKILLVGGLGFIGKHVIRSLAGSSNLVVLSDAQAATRNQRFIKTYGLRVEEGDITEAARLTELMLKEMPDAVIHLAALTGIAKCNENPSLAFSINVFGTYNVIMGCVACNSRLIFISSREVYGETTSDQTREDDPLVPNNIYGVTKLLGERLLIWAAQKYGLDYVILRLTNVYGPKGEQYNIQAMIHKAMTEGRIQLLGGNQRMNLIYVEDVAEAICRCLTEPQASRQIFNVGSQEDLAVEDIVGRLVSMLGTSVRIDREPMRAGETLNFRPTLDRIERVLGWHARIAFGEGLRRTIEWYRKKHLDESESD